MRKNQTSVAGARFEWLERANEVRREDSLNRLRNAADRIFSERGYIATSIEEIARSAGVSRPTFYRHFSGKFAIALDMFDRESELVAPLWRSLSDRNYRDLAAVTQWVGEIMDFEKSRPALFRIIVELGLAEPAFLERATAIVPGYIVDLAEAIPAFAATQGDDEAAQNRWVEAWLILEEILFQAKAGGIGYAMAARHLVAHHLATRLHRFILTLST